VEHLDRRRLAHVDVDPHVAGEARLRRIEPEVQIVGARLHPVGELDPGRTRHGGRRTIGRRSARRRRRRRDPGDRAGSTPEGRSEEDAQDLTDILRRHGWAGPRLLALPDYRTFGQLMAHLLGGVAVWAKDAGHQGLVVLLDDVGFGASSAFGGACRTPTAERLAAGGLAYNRFHTTALCAPTPAALLPGRNHHTVGMGAITEVSTSAPGYSSIRPNTCAPLPETLRLNGYSTAQFGKCHEVPVWQTSPMGPFDAWPTGGGGFEHFFGFIGG